MVASVYRPRDWGLTARNGISTSRKHSVQARGELGETIWGSRFSPCRVRRADYRASRGIGGVGEVVKKGAGTRRLDAGNVRKTGGGTVDAVGE